MKIFQIVGANSKTIATRGKLHYFPIYLCPIIQLSLRDSTHLTCVFLTSYCFRRRRRNDDYNKKARLTK